MKAIQALFLFAILSITFARPTLLIIDASGSMDDIMADGTSKIDAAKIAAKQIVQNANDEIALMIYDDCDAGGDPHSGPIRVVVEFTTDKSTLTSEIDAIEPWGGTPIAGSIEEGMIYVSATGKNAGIILLTDGEETCDDVSYAAQMASQASQYGVVIINIVGFQLDEYAQDEMEAIAAAAGGNYYDAQDVSSLTTSLQQAYTSASGGGLLDMCCGSVAGLLGILGLVIIRG